MWKSIGWLIDFKTLQEFSISGKLMLHAALYYDKTNKFYLALGFKEFEVFPTLWDEWNPCQIYVMAI